MTQKKIRRCIDKELKAKEQILFKSNFKHWNMSNKKPKKTFNKETYGKISIVESVFSSLKRKSVNQREARA